MSEKQQVIIRGVSGRKISCASVATLDAFLVNLKQQFPTDFDRDTLFFLSPEGSKLEPSSLAQLATVNPVILFQRSDFSDSSSSEISEPDNFRLALKALARFLARRRETFEVAISGFASAVTAHSQKTSEVLGSLEATLGNLKKIELHASLVSETAGRTLFDAVPHGRISDFQGQLDRQLADLVAKVATWKSQASDLCVAMTAAVETLSIGNSEGLGEFGRCMAAVRKTEMAGVLLEEAFARSRKSLGQLQHLEKMPQAYDKTLGEIARRKFFKERYLGRMAAMRTELGNLKKEEDERRKRFFNKYAVHLPVGLVPGLGEFVAPALVELQTDFDAELPLVIANSSQLSSSSMEPQASQYPNLAGSTRFLHPSEY